MIYFVKWLNARLFRLINRVKWNLVLEFYLTFLIPSLYLANIYIAFITPKTLSIPLFLSLNGILIAFLGLTIWIISYINLGFYFGVLPKKQKRIKRGLYKYTNHPMYIGIWLVFFGLSLANSSLEGLFFLFVLITPMLIIRAYLEDKILID
jgi:protein-S-isoprenylcysteine O-methyltransferase Ste14